MTSDSSSSSSMNITTFAAFKRSILAPNTDNLHVVSLNFVQSLFANLSEWSQDDLIKLHELMQCNSPKSCPLLQCPLLQTAYNQARFIELERILLGVKLDIDKVSLILSFQMNQMNQMNQSNQAKQLIDEMCQQARLNAEMDIGSLSLIIPCQKIQMNQMNQLKQMKQLIDELYQQARLNAEMQS